METTPSYGVTMLVTPPPGSLTQEQFHQQALALVLAAGPQYLTDTIVAHRAAHTRLGVAVGPLTRYTAQVWDLSRSTPAKTLGKFQVVAEAETPEACLAALAAKLAELDVQALHAEPTFFGNRQVASHLALVEAA